MIILQFTSGNSNKRSPFLFADFVLIDENLVYLFAYLPLVVWPTLYLANYLGE